MTENKIENAKLLNVKEALAEGTNGVILGTFILNLMLSTSMNLLWGMINALQIIGNMPKFNLYVPANVLEFYTFINKV